MVIKVLIITYNRPKYTELSLTRLCDSASQNVKLTIWDNGSNEQTRKVLKRFTNHSRVERVIFNKTNEKLRRPTNWFWENSLDADLLGKVDDDCLVPENWCSVLGQAHQDITNAGILSCWHFFPQDFDYELAKKKIHFFGNHQIMRNCWVGGSGYLMKSEVIRQIGFIEQNETFTDFCIRASARGFVNGWYYPFLYQEHMDDPRSAHTGIRSDEDLQKMMPLTAVNFGIKTRLQWIQWNMENAKRLQEYSIDPKDFLSLRSVIMDKLMRKFGKEYFPKIK